MPNSVESWLEDFPRAVCTLLLGTEEIFSTVSSSCNTFEDFYCLFLAYSSATAAAHGSRDADNESYQHFPLRMMSTKSKGETDRSSGKLSGGEGHGTPGASSTPLLS